MNEREFEAAVDASLPTSFTRYTGTNVNSRDISAAVYVQIPDGDVQVFDICMDTYDPDKGPWYFGRFGCMSAGRTPLEAIKNYLASAEESLSRQLQDVRELQSKVEHPTYDGRMIRPC